MSQAGKCIRSGWWQRGSPDLPATRFRSQEALAAARCPTTAIVLSIFRSAAKRSPIFNLRRSIADWSRLMPDQNLVAAIGGTATVLAVVSLLPQVVRTLRTRSANDLSLTWLVIAMVSMILWIAYG